MTRSLNNHTKVFPSFLVLLITLSALLTPGIGQAQVLNTQGDLEFIEEGIILNPEAIQTIGVETSGNPSPDSSHQWDAVPSTISEQSVDVLVKHQNPKYASQSRSVTRTACTNSNYRVISKASVGTIPVQYTYTYTCYAGKGVRNIGMEPSAGSVVKLCPGNNRNASIYFQNTGTQDRNWYWSNTHPPTSSNWQCYTFAGDNEGYYRGVRYTKVRLN